MRILPLACALLHGYNEPMVDVKKLLYILTDVAYVVELLPTKKAHTFSIQSFRQINGTFLDDNVLLANSIEKLCSKIDADTYHVILPDFIFTNTIVSINETDGSKIVEYLKDSLFPEINISTETHVIESFVLTEHRGSSKTQLSAIEKEVLQPLAAAAKKYSIDISAVSPVSWTLKSIISLEPSISLVQLGSHLYSAQQYIGVDQTTIAPVSQVAAIAETIKTLKGAEPSIQTVYLLTNTLVEEQLKTELKDTLPIQQLAKFQEESSKMPSYVQQAIEAAAKTTDISDYPVPQFDMSKIPTDLTPQNAVETAAVVSEDAEDEQPTSSEPKVVLTPLSLDDDSAVEQADQQESELTELPKPSSNPMTIAAQPVTVTAAATAAAAPQEQKPTEEKAPLPAKKSIEKPIVKTTEPKVAPAVSTTHHQEKRSENMPQEEHARPVIKNKSGVSSMIKMILLSVGVFIVTVGIGVAVGMTVFRKDTTQQETPVVETEATPEPSATPEPTPDPAEATESASTEELDKSKLKILVVNATTKAGYAGTVKGSLDDAGYGTVSAGNAQGTYDAGIYALMTEENSALIQALAADTNLDVVFQDGIETETTDTSFDAVVVLAE